MSILWIIAAAVLAVALLKTTVKILKFVFTVLLIGAVVLLVMSLGIL